jgi:hypothetical protein
MVQSLQAKDVGLKTLTRSFGLKWIQSEGFFTEWQTNLLELTAQEKQQLDQIKNGYFNQIQDPPLLEQTIQMIVVAPLLFLAGLYLPPFHIHAEKSIAISSEDDGIVIRGALDILLLRDGFC